MHSKYELPENSAFETVYLLAKAQNYVRLSVWLQETNNTVSLWDGFSTPILKLAEEGDKEAVDFLIEKFQGNSCYALEGYARSGRVKLVDELLPLSNPSYAARGYAEAGLTEELSKLRESTKIELEFVIEGIARRGQIKEIELVLEGVSKPRRGVLLSYAMGGFAYSKNEEAIKQFNWDGLPSEVLGATKLSIYARMGDMEMVKLLIKNYDVKHALVGLVRGGHIAKAKKLLPKIGMEEQLVAGFALGGHINEANSCMRNETDKLKAIANYALEGHFNQVNTLFNRCNPQDIHNYIATIYHNYREGGYLHPNHLLRLLYLTESALLTHFLLMKASSFYPEINKQKLQDTLMQYEDFKCDGLSFEEARRHVMINCHIKKTSPQDEKGIGGTEYWLLKGQHEMLALPAEILTHINTFLTNTTQANTLSYLTTTHSRMQRKKNEKEGSFLTRTFKGVMLDELFSKKFGYVFGEALNPASEDFGANESFNMQLYAYVFSLSLESGLTSDVLKAIQQKFSDSSKPETFRNNSCYTSLNLPKKHEDNEETKFCYYMNPNITWAGFKELMQNLLINTKKPAHYVHFKGISERLGENIYILPYHPFLKTLSGLNKKVVIMTIMNDRLTGCAVYDSEENDRQLQWALSHMSFEAYLNSTPEDQPQLSAYSPDKIDEFIQQEIDELCLRYNTKIKEATSQDEKILVIVQYIQLIYQLMPFDKNYSSVFYLLLNRLLHEEKMPLTLLLDSNRLFAFGSDELLDLIKKGQANYLKLLQGQKVSFLEEFTIYDPEITPDKIAISLDESDSLHSMFMDNISRLEKKYTENLLMRNHPSLVKNGMYAESKTEKKEESEIVINPVL
ncbi:MAG: hypothetical protein WC785_05645 [Tatlockia sp.]|jgi:hypothetical protein